MYRGLAVLLACAAEVSALADGRPAPDLLSIAAETGARETSNDLWKAATRGGRVVQAGGLFLMFGRDGALLGANRLGDGGRLEASFSGRAAGGQWIHETIYSDPRNGGASLIRLRHAPTGNLLLEELSRLAPGGDLIEVVRRRYDPTQPAKAPEVIRVLIPRLPRQTALDDARGCRPSQSVLDANPSLRTLFDNMGGASTGNVSCAASTVPERSTSFEQMPYGILIGSKCGAGAGGAEKLAKLKTATLNALRTGMTCLTEIGGQATDLAVRLSGILQQGEGSSGERLALRAIGAIDMTNRRLASCASPEPFRLDCADEPCGNWFGNAAGPPDADWPGLTINMGGYDWTGAATDLSNPEHLPRTIFHEMLHTTGVLHGQHADVCYAAEAACFPPPAGPSAASAEAGRLAARRILHGDHTDAADPAYLADIFKVFRGTDQDFMVAHMIGMTLFNPELDTTPIQQWFPPIEAMVTEMIENGDATLAAAVAEVEIDLALGGSPPANMEVGRRFETLLARARTRAAPTDTADGRDRARTAAFVAHCVRLVQTNNTEMLPGYLESAEARAAIALTQRSDRGPDPTEFWSMASHLADDMVLVGLRRARDGAAAARGGSRVTERRTWEALTARLMPHYGEAGRSGNGTPGCP